jgi:hypothetical protein
MTNNDLHQDKIQRLQDEYEKYLDKLYELKMKKLGILVDYRKKMDEAELAKLRGSYKEEARNV